MRFNSRLVPAFPPEVLAANFRSCIARRLAHVEVGPALPQKVAIVAGAPSVVDHLETFRNWDGFVVAINGAHDWLQDHGVCPDAMILCDASPDVARYCRNPNEETTYLVASCCDPSVFDALLTVSKRVVMFHSMQGLMFEGEVENGNPLIVGGPSCATRAPYLLHTMGFREFHLFGVDSSFGDRAETHGVLNCGPSVHEGRKSDPIFVECPPNSGQFFMTEIQLVIQAEFLQELVARPLVDSKIEIHGKGLAPALIAAKGAFSVLPQ